jgi:TatD DNase family protein
MPYLVDSHAHLTFSDTFDIEALLTNAKRAKVNKIINICTDTLSFERGEKVANLHPWIYNAAALSPHDVEKKEAENFFKQVELAAKAKKIVAVGETGLDYYYHKRSQELQKEYFIRHIELAKKYSLPLIIHCREAFVDLFEISAKYLPFPALLHCFTGSLDEAIKATNLGWFISISGILTFPKSQELRSVVEKIPLEKMMIETDSPFLAPQKYRGKSNQPAFVIEIAQKIAELKNCPVEKVIEVTAENAISFFSL